MAKRCNNDDINRRRQEILGLISSASFMTIEAISSSLGLSNSTVRRDVNWLIEQNKLKRFHGGVTSQEQNRIAFGIRDKTRTQEKTAIGGFAASLVQDNDFIYIGAGSTARYFSQALAKRQELQNVTVVTATFNIATCFIDAATNFKIIILGGVLTDFEECMSSKLVLDSISQFYFTKSFSSHVGVSVTSGLTANRLDNLEIDQAIYLHTQEHIILVDHTKIGVVCPFSFVPFEGISVLVTDDHEASRKELERYSGDQVKVYMV